MKCEVADSRLNREFREALIKAGLFTEKGIANGEYASSGSMTATELLEAMTKERDDPTPQD